MYIIIVLLVKCIQYVPVGEEVAAVDGGVVAPVGKEVAAVDGVVVAAVGGETEAWQLSQGKQTRSGDMTPRF